MALRASKGTNHVPRVTPACIADGVAFGPWFLDIAAQGPGREGVSQALTSRQFAVLHLLITHAGTIVPKETSRKTVWGDVAARDNSVERMTSDIRMLLDPVDRRQSITWRGRTAERTPGVTPHRSGGGSKARTGTQDGSTVAVDTRAVCAGDRPASAFTTSSSSRS